LRRPSICPPSVVMNAGGPPIARGAPYPGLGEQRRRPCLGLQRGGLPFSPPPSRAGIGLCCSNYRLPDLGLRRAPCSLLSGLSSRPADAGRAVALPPASTQQEYIRGKSESSPGHQAPAGRPRTRRLAARSITTAAGRRRGMAAKQTVGCSPPCCCCCKTCCPHASTVAARSPTLPSRFTSLASASRPARKRSGPRTPGYSPVGRPRQPPTETPGSPAPPGG
jgi:hypothetical protein